MREYFQGWKQKAGVVTLLIACGFTAGWVRSLWEVDQALYLRDSQTLHIVHSSPSGIGWTALCETTSTPILGTTPVGMISLESFHASGHTNVIYPFDWKHTHWGSQWSGFHAGAMYSESLPPSPPSSREIRTWIVRYQSLVVPLMLLSAYLLLSRAEQARVQFLGPYPPSNPSENPHS